MLTYRPGDPGYDEHRLGWQRTFDSRPAAVVAAETTEDVRAAVLAARAGDLPLAVQATGHGAIVAADGALLLKTTALTDI
jgi:FAD/FMN-containing dehydrogenase